MLILLPRRPHCQGEYEDVVVAATPPVRIEGLHSSTDVSTVTSSRALRRVTYDHVHGCRISAGHQPSICHNNKYKCSNSLLRFPLILPLSACLVFRVPV